jgi:hypothetical protein
MGKHPRRSERGMAAFVRFLFVKQSKWPKKTPEAAPSNEVCLSMIPIMAMPCEHCAANVPLAWGRFLPCVEHVSSPRASLPQMKRTTR